MDKHAAADAAAAAAAEDVETGEHERKGTVWTATAHIVTAVIGSGVLALAWSVAQLGWVAGPLALVGFACVTYYTSTLLANAYRAPDPVTGARNHTYTDAVRSYLSPREVFMCGIAQYGNLWGTMVGYTITATISMVAIRRSDCVHENGQGARCDAPGTVLMLAFTVVQVVLSQFPGLEHITWLSVVAAVMSFAYSFIGLALSVTEWASHGLRPDGRIAGATAASSSKKTWDVLLALGNIAFAYTFAEVLIEIQDTLKSPPSEHKTMKKAAMYGIGATTIFYISVGCAGYAAFGSDAPGNILTAPGLGPFWLVDIANMCLILHLIGAYQVYAQPIFATAERWIVSRWPDTKFISSAYTVSIPLMQRGSVTVAPYKLVLRTVIVIATTVVAMMIPFFNAVLGLLGAFSFWPLTVYFPISMHIAQGKITKGTKWYLLQGLSMVCLMISVAVGIGSVSDIVDSLKVSTPFKTVS
ncbi:hypothetical protein CFC21_043132 [Triticum aestivum]|uniref:Amino acid transporter transmembrane domain-containing protein n=3 Tax=Triticum TaxID=4564 RepID=A0A9R1S659_TRITD|nr:amino acid permease 6-like [Triticum aestivum]KAF7031880.1 hypothetical protein CFC21_043132 [Triticum aestivum]CDJ26456.1 unnamed protein product [Triticum aestivum]CDM82686.1 unnamed protein product [Triticum aestivum]VAH82507.1 unnamed protein product [Triticum turgidum subsp. durum]